MPKTRQYEPAKGHTKAQSLLKIPLIDSATLNYSALARIRNSACVCRRIFGSSDVTCCEMAVKAGFAAGPICVSTVRAR